MRWKLEGKVISNQLPFDPLNATPEEEAGMMKGYLAAGLAPRDAACPETASIAFAHGWRMRKNDRAGVVDDDQRELAQRMLARA